MEFYYFSNHFTTIMLGCYNSARLQTPCTNCHNIVTTLSQPYKVAARLLQSSYFRMGIDKWLACKMAWLCAYLNYSQHRVEFSTSLSYLNVYCLQVNMYCRE